MKEKLVTLIVGILIGAIIVGGGFYIYSKNKTSSEDQGKMRGPNYSMQNGTLEEPPSKSFNNTVTEEAE